MASSTLPCRLGTPGCRATPRCTQRLSSAPCEVRRRRFCGCGSCPDNLFSWHAIQEIRRDLLLARRAAAAGQGCTRLCRVGSRSEPTLHEKFGKSYGEYGRNVSASGAACVRLAQVLIRCAQGLEEGRLL